MYTLLHLLLITPVTFIRQVVYDVQQRAGQIQGSMSVGAQGGGGIPQDIQSIIYKLQENMNFVRSDLANVANRPQVSGTVSRWICEINSLCAPGTL